jgi:hypothetical protein
MANTTNAVSSTPSWNVPIFSEAQKLANIQNWVVFKQNIFMAARSRACTEYLTRTIHTPGTDLSNKAGHSHAASKEEYDVCDGWLVATIFQNIIDPSGHGLTKLMTAAEMYKALTNLLDQKSEMSKAAKEHKLRSRKFQEGGDFEEHIKALMRMHTEANAAGC